MRIQLISVSYNTYTYINSVFVWTINGNIYNQHYDDVYLWPFIHVNPTKKKKLIIIKKYSINKNLT